MDGVLRVRAGSAVKEMGQSTAHNRPYADKRLEGLCRSEAGRGKPHRGRRREGKGGGERQSGRRSGGGRRRMRPAVGAVGAAAASDIHEVVGGGDYSG